MRITTTKITFDGADVDFIHGAVIAAREATFKRWIEQRGDGSDAKLEAFYAAAFARHDAMLARFEALRVADTSQDAEPDQDEEEEG